MVVYVQFSLGPLHASGRTVSGREERKATALSLRRRLVFGQVRAAQNVYRALQSYTGHSWDKKCSPENPNPKIVESFKCSG